MIILASKSPRRIELLEKIGCEFTAVSPEMDESGVRESDPAALTVKLASLKAKKVSKTYPGAVVIGADTVVAADGRVLGKPRDARDAKESLAFLSGRAHSVFTGVFVTDGRRETSAFAETRVHFKPLTSGEIERYVATGEPLDKAGAYGAQGKGALIVEKIEGDFFNVVGLPLCLLARLMREFGIELL